jgi:hypothetical protein
MHNPTATRIKLTTTPFCYNSLAMLEMRYTWTNILRTPSAVLSLTVSDGFAFLSGLLWLDFRSALGVLMAADPTFHFQQNDDHFLDREQFFWVLWCHRHQKLRNNLSLREWNICHKNYRQLLGKQIFKMTLASVSWIIRSGSINKRSMAS